ncbi:hypothetical protein EV694_1258 [Volucribacter psittacicida]|uniref:LysB family phage lysis regulatory protein n=1 Tax=Volucribacter psittacicida TaxID=203482 RepID=A0A4R1G548_9PAST|nr:hypothetical protein [Volucribacter psittacicida]TCJ98831.1 hypothetical protein EV694_1258 [Volucribacter psittacicida]
MDLVKRALLFFCAVSLLGLSYFYWQYKTTYHKYQVSQIEKQTLQLQLVDSHQQIADFYQQTKAMTLQINQLTQQTEQRQNALNQALQHHQDWANQPVPNDVIRLFNKASNTHKNADNLPHNERLQNTK